MPTFHIRNKKRIRKKSALLFVCLVLLFIDNLNSFCVCFFFLFKNKPFAINQPVRDHIVSVFFWKNVCVLCFFLNYLARFSLLCPVLLCMCLLYIYNNAGEYKNQVFMLMERLYILSFLLFFFHSKFMSAERTITGDSQISVSPNTGILSCCWPCVSTSKGHQPVSLSCAFDWIFFSSDGR